MKGKPLNQEVLFTPSRKTRIGCPATGKKTHRVFEDEFGARCLDCNLSAEWCAAIRKVEP